MVGIECLPGKSHLSQRGPRFVGARQPQDLGYRGRAGVVIEEPPLKRMVFPSHLEFLNDLKHASLLE